MRGYAARRVPERTPMLAERFHEGDAVVSYPGGMKGKVIGVFHFLSGRRYKVEWENGHVGTVSPGCLRRDTIATLTRYQLDALRYAAEHGPLDHRSGAQSAILKLSLTALGTVIDTLQRRGLIEEDGSISPAGVAALAAYVKGQLWLQKNEV